MRRSIIMKTNPPVSSPPRRDRRAHDYKRGTQPTNGTAACAVPLERRESLFGGHRTKFSAGASQNRMNSSQILKLLLSRTDNALSLPPRSSTFYGT